MAQDRGYDDVYQILLKAGAKSGVDCLPTRNRTLYFTPEEAIENSERGGALLISYARNSDTEGVEYLLTHLDIARICSQDECCMSVLSIALQQGHFELLKSVQAYDFAGRLEILNMQDGHAFETFSRRLRLLDEIQSVSFCKYLKASVKSAEDPSAVLKVYLEEFTKERKESQASSCDASCFNPKRKLILTFWAMVQNLVQCQDFMVLCLCILMDLK